jgi:uncharacterized glyoxalase superfamily protein PhnB
MQLTPYLNFNGQCEETFNFYQRTDVLGREIRHAQGRYGIP